PGEEWFSSGARACAGAAPGPSSKLDTDFQFHKARSAPRTSGRRKASVGGSAGRGLSGNAVRSSKVAATGGGRNRVSWANAWRPPTPAGRSNQRRGNVTERWRLARERAT